MTVASEANRDPQWAEKSARKEALRAFKDLPRADRTAALQLGRRHQLHPDAHIRAVTRDWADAWIAQWGLSRLALMAVVGAASALTLAGLRHVSPLFGLAATSWLALVFASTTFRARRVQRANEDPSAVIVAPELLPQVVRDTADFRPRWFGQAALIAAGLPFGALFLGVGLTAFLDGESDRGVAAVCMVLGVGLLLGAVATLRARRRTKARSASQFQR